MADFVKETIVTRGSTSNENSGSSSTREASSSQTIEYLVYFLFGMLEVLLAFRLVLKLAGANPMSTFVSFVYGVSGLFIMPFEGIFRRAINKGVETASVLEPATIVALLVYAVIAWGIVLLIRISSGEKQAD